MHTTNVIELSLSDHSFCVDWEAPDDFHPETTDEVRDFEKNQFLDLRKPLLRQVWEANFRCALSVGKVGYT